MPEIQQIPPRTILEVFQMLPEGTHAEVIDNSLYMSPALSTPHQQVCISIASEMFLHAKKKKLGKVFSSPIDVYLDKKNAFQPDIIFISEANTRIIKEEAIYGAPDLVIEILSAGTRNLDLTKKKMAYEKAGVKEYRVIDPTTKESKRFNLARGKYARPVHETGKLTSLILHHTFKF